MQSHQKEKKGLSMPALLKNVRKVFNQIPDRKTNRVINLSDSIMSALAMFALKSPSLLAFDEQKINPIVKHNVQTLYGIQNVPCDTYMRESLDEVEAKRIRSCFLSIFHEVQRGKLLERYRFLGSYLCLVDGTQIFHSEKVHCVNCCEKKHRDGRVTYHHQILGAVIAKPGLSQVIPLCPEAITKQDGSTKNDCERNAFHRFLRDTKKEHPHLNLTMVSDALSANAVHVRELYSLGYHFIIVVKPEGNRSLFEWINGVTQKVEMTVGKNKYAFQYVNEVPLNGTKEAPLVNFLQCEATEIEGRRVKTKHFSWVTDHKITKDNIYELMRGGRARWKVENETFNTLKNQGYQFEHNFGHGKKNLHTVFAFLMMLVFLIDQVQEASYGLFQDALERKSKRAFWEKIRSFFHLYLIKTWQDLFLCMSKAFKGVELVYDTS